MESSFPFVALSDADQVVRMMEVNFRIESCLFEVIRPMRSGSGGAGFTENVSELVVVWQNTSHVDQGVIGSGLVRKKELVDLVIVPF